MQNLLNNQTGSNSSKILIASKDISHIVLPADTEDNETRCGMERDLLTSMVENVLHVSQVNCRRKKKLIKIWHKPKPGESSGQPAHRTTSGKIKVASQSVVVSEVMVGEVVATTALKTCLTKTGLF